MFGSGVLVGVGVMVDVDVGWGVKVDVTVATEVAVTVGVAFAAHELSRTTNTVSKTICLFILSSLYNRFAQAFYE